MVFRCENQLGEKHSGRGTEDRQQKRPGKHLAEDESKKEPREPADKQPVIAAPVDRAGDGGSGIDAEEDRRQDDQRHQGIPMRGGQAHHSLERGPAGGAERRTGQGNTDAVTGWRHGEFSVNSSPRCRLGAAIIVRRVQVANSSFRNVPRFFTSAEDTVEREQRTLRIVCLSDTHTRHWDVNVPHGDILIHAGDFTKRGSLRDLRDFNAFLGELPHRHKIVVAGNHDFCFEDAPADARPLLTNAVYLQDEAVCLAGLKFFGSPWQPWFFDWAFNLPRGAALREKWDRIPHDIDVLITHTPPSGILDRTATGAEVGCADLREAVRGIRPRLHVFGHIHEAAGVTRRDGTTFVNACVCTLAYEPDNPVIVVEIDPDGSVRSISPD